MTDKTEDRDAKDVHKASRAAIGSAALTAAVLYAPSCKDHRDDKPSTGYPAPPDTD